MTPEKQTGTIRQQISIRGARPEDVYRAFLSSKQHSELTGSPAKCTAKVGNRFTAWDSYISGKNLRLVKNKKIVQEWRTTEWPEGYGPSILNISLKSERDGTQISMVQTRVPASQVEQYDQGWYESYWNPMKEYFRRKALRQRSKAASREKTAKR